MVKNFLFLMSFLGVLIFGSSGAFAGGPLNPPQKINFVAFQTNGLLLYADSWPNPNGCTTTAAVMLLKTDPNYDKAFALLLTAYASGKEVSGYSDGCSAHDAHTFNTIRGHKYLVVR